MSCLLLLSSTTREPYLCSFMWVDCRRLQSKQRNNTTLAVTVYSSYCCVILNVCHGAVDSMQHTKKVSQPQNRGEAAANALDYLGPEQMQSPFRTTVTRGKNKHAAGCVSGHGTCTCPVPSGCQADPSWAKRSAMEAWSGR